MQRVGKVCGRREIVTQWLRSMKRAASCWLTSRFRCVKPSEAVRIDETRSSNHGVFTSGVGETGDFSCLSTRRNVEWTRQCLALLRRRFAVLGSWVCATSGWLKRIRSEAKKLHGSLPAPELSNSEARPRLSRQVARRPSATSLCGAVGIRSAGCLHRARRRKSRGRNAGQSLEHCHV